MRIHARSGALLLLACMVACVDSSSLELREWQLIVDGRESPTSVVVPTHLDDGRVPDGRVRYRLNTTVVVPPAWRSEPLP